MGNMVETVFAKSSGAGVSAICVIRISGPDALKTINTLLKSDLKLHLGMQYCEHYGGVKLN